MKSLRSAGSLQAARRNLGQLLGQVDVRRIGVERGSVDQLAGLLLHGLRHLGVVVAHAGGQNAAEEVEIFVAVGVPHAQPITVRQGQRFRVVENVVGP